MDQQQGIWLGLLKWSLAHSDGTAPSASTAMSGEDKMFLERVMKEMTRDEPERMKEIMLELVTFVDAAAASPSAASANEGRIEGLLDELADITEQIDMAQVFCKFGGLQCVLSILENGSLGSEVRSTSAGVLATLSQNNLVVQDLFFAQGVVQRLSTLAVSSLASESTKTLGAKVVHSLSCSIRNHPAAEEYFSLNYGHTLLGLALPLSPPSVLSSIANLTTPNAYSTPTTVCMRRAVYLANALLASDTRSAPRLRHLLPAVVPAVFQCLALNDLDLREGTSRLLLTIMSIPAGHATLTASPHRETLFAALHRRKTETLADDEQEVHERAMADELLALMEEGAGPSIASHVERSAADSGPDDGDWSGAAGSSALPLMLEENPER